MKTRTCKQKQENTHVKTCKTLLETEDAMQKMCSSLELVTSIYFPKSKISKDGDDWILYLHSGKKINLGNRYMEAIENVLDFFKNRNLAKIKI